jgi:hypothetical protein
MSAVYGALAEPAGNIDVDMTRTDINNYKS